MSTPTKWGTEIHVNTVTQGNQANWSNAALADGRFVVSWNADGNLTDVHAQMFHADGTKDGGEITVNTTLTNSQAYPQVAARSDGGFVIVWHDSSQTIRAQIFHPDGSKQGGELTVVSGIQSISPDVIMLSNNHYVVTWKHGGNTGTYGHIFDANGAPLGNEFQVAGPVAGAQGDASDPVIAALEFGFAAAWTETDGTQNITHTQLYFANGAKNGAEVQVVNQSNGHEFIPAIAAAGGGYIIAWTDGVTGDLRAQRFKFDGTETGSPITLKHESGVSNGPVALTGIPDGHFFAAWQRASNGTDFDIRGQFFAADGNPVGDEVVVDSMPNGFVYAPTLATLEDGRVVVSWTFGQQPNSPDPGLGVYAQIIDPRQGPAHLNGTALDDEYVGTTFSEEIDGGSGNDVLIGGGGDDIFLGGAGADTLIGGPGVHDTAAYNGSPSGVKVSLFTGAGTGGDAAGDVLSGIENLFGSAFDDTLTGDGGDNRLEGRGGADILNGGNGNDTASYRFSDAVIVNLANGSGSGGAAAGDTLSNIENVDGGDHNDVLIGDAKGNILYGAFGDDTLKGGGGADTLYGGGDIDTAMFTGASTDYKIIRLANGDVQITDLRAGSPDGIDTLRGIEKFLFSDGTFDQTVFVNQSPVIGSNGGGDIAAVSMPENDTAAATVWAYDLDPGTTLTYAISGGADAGKFQINAATGALSFIAAPDYEAPADADHNNSYVVQVGVSDGALSDSQVLTVNVTDVAPVINGDAGNNTLSGTPENDTINGLGGDDTVVFSHSLDQYVLTDLGNKIIVQGPDGPDVLIGIEHLQFTDGTINVDDGNPLFDTVYYMSHNLDVFHAGANALAHFTAWGWHEGRDPNALFSVNAYLNSNPDVKASGMNPLDHYHQIGWHQGRDPGANFDTRLYLVHNPDVAAAGIDPLAHYLANGAAEGRQAYQAIGTAVNGFDAEYYLMHNPDVAAAGVDPLAHFNANGWHEGRNPNAWFDTAGYLAHYGDVAAAGINPLQHYEQFGWLEGRDPSAGFDTNGYLAANPDVAAAHINPLDHFINNGIYEGRAAINDGLWH